MKVLLVLALSFTTLPLFAGSSMAEKYERLEIKTKAKIEVLDKKLDRFGKKITNLNGEAKIKMKSQYEKLVEMKSELKEKLEEAGDATEENWENIKSKIEVYADNLENKIDKAIN